MTDLNRAARVGIVVVSHSKQLAAGVVELVEQMASGVQLVAAGGMADGAIGTDAVLIADAIAQADTGAGVLVLADLGSAVLSANLALETLVDPRYEDRLQAAAKVSSICWGISPASNCAAKMACPAMASIARSHSAPLRGAMRKVTL